METLKDLKFLLINLMLKGQAGGPCRYYRTQAVTTEWSQCSNTLYGPCGQWLVMFL